MVVVVVDYMVVVVVDNRLIIIKIIFLKKTSINIYLAVVDTDFESRYYLEEIL
jgi:hypothetical protein